MEVTLKALGMGTPILTKYWSRYFSETPMCSCEGCTEVAREVDPFFPYLDDLNRCADHGIGGGFSIS